MRIKYFPETDCALADHIEYSVQRMLYLSLRIYI